VWERVNKEKQRITLAIEADRLRLKAVDAEGEMLLLLEADHRVTKDSILFGIVTSVESTGVPVWGENGKAIWLPVDTLFSWRFRVDGDVLTVKEPRPEALSFDGGGRFKRQCCGKGKCEPCVRPKVPAEQYRWTAYLYSALKKDGMIAHPSLPFSMYVKAVKGRKLILPVFKRRGPRGQTDVVANARQAELRVDTTRPSGPVLLILMKDGVASSEGGDRAHFEQRTFEVPLPPNLGKDSNVDSEEEPTADK
jgi:hypothetical protein